MGRLAGVAGTVGAMPTRLPAASWLAAFAIALLALGLAGSLVWLPPPAQRLAGFDTSLTGRTGAQRHNALLSAHALDGATVAPGGVFSFNRAVRSWSADTGYVKAPVSFEGELIAAYGGGVCQTSTTLYNAVLLAGLPVVERHHHVFAPHYVPPGRDAAVAYPTLDLRFRNPHPYPLRISAWARGEHLSVSLWAVGAGNGPVGVKPALIETEVLDRIAPGQRTRSAGPGTNAALFHRNAGGAGWHVVTWRVGAGPGTTRRERISEDTYPALDRVVTVGGE